MIGLSHQIVAAGLSKPCVRFEKLNSEHDGYESIESYHTIFRSLNNTCVNAHLKPPLRLALMTRMKPTRTKCVWVKTIRSTPETMRRITKTRRHDGCSSLKRKAKRRTNIKDEDLHIAISGALVRQVSRRDE